MPKSTREHEIDRLAQARFDKATAKWPRMKPDTGSDYTLDYLLQPTMSTGPNVGTLAGNDFFVQLKGQENPQYSSHQLLYRRLRVSDAVYYLDKCTAPVYLVVIDITRDEGYWVSIRSALGRPDAQSWRRQATVTVRLPIENSIDNHEPWLRDIAEDWKRLRDIRSEDPRVALRRLKERLEQETPGLIVAPRASLGGTEIVVQQVPDDELTFTFSGETSQVRKAYDLAVGAGRAIRASELGVTIGASMGREKQYRPIPSIDEFHLERTEPVLVKVYAEANDGRKHSPLQISADMKGGMSEMRLDAALRSGILRVSLTSRFPTNSNESPIEGQMTISLDSWRGRSVLFLDDMDIIHELLSPLRLDDSKLKMDVFWRGNFLASTTIGDTKSEQLAAIAQMVRAISAASEVARRTGQELTVPTVWTSMTSAAPLAAKAVLDGEESSFDVRGLKISTDFPRSMWIQRDANGVPPGLMRMNLPMDDFSVDVWGSQVDLGYCMLEILGVRPTSAQLLEDDGSDNVFAEFRFDEVVKARCRKCELGDE